MEGAWQPAPEAWWAAIWPQRRFDTNTSNQLLYAGGGSFDTDADLFHVYIPSIRNFAAVSLPQSRKETTQHITQKMVSRICVTAG
jgi:hypothetical protein